MHTNKESSEHIEINLTLKNGHFSLKVNTLLPTTGVTVIYGPSGSGKTSLLRCIAGLNKHSVGTLRVCSYIWQSPNTFLPTYKRPIGYVFQESNLFDHLTAQQNLDFAIKRAHKIALATTSNRQHQHAFKLDHIIELLDLKNFLDQYPRSLSGGQKQRVAIARALLIQPQLLILDEPLASIDESKKQDVLPYLELLKRKLKLPILYVTHAAKEVARLADHLLVLDEGNIIAQGSLHAVLKTIDLPLNLNDQFGVVIESKVKKIDKQWQLAQVSLGEHISTNMVTEKHLSLWFPCATEKTGDVVRIQIFAKDVSIALNRPEKTSILNTLPAIIVDVGQDHTQGHQFVKLQVGAHHIIAKISSRSIQLLNIKKGIHLWIQIKSTALVI